MDGAEGFCEGQTACPMKCPANQLGIPSLHGAEFTASVPPRLGQGDCHLSLLEGGYLGIHVTLHFYLQHATGWIFLSRAFLEQHCMASIPLHRHGALLRPPNVPRGQRPHGLRPHCGGTGGSYTIPPGAFADGTQCTYAHC